MEPLIFGTDLGSLVESVYLGIPYTDNQRGYGIIVNPYRVTYIVGKTVIINRFDYPQDLITELSRNNNTIISRVWKESEGVIFDPYLPRINMKIQWNGEVLETLGEENIEMNTQIYYSMDSDTLFFPKVRYYRDLPGPKGEMNFIGYLLYQTGRNLYKESEFKNLDLIKCKKG